MKRNIFILVLSAIAIVNIYSCNTNCEINVDSLFQINLSTLKKNISGSNENVTIVNRNSLEFLYAVSVLSGIDFINVKDNSTNLKLVLAIESWYSNKKKFITCEKIKKAYLLIKPHLFKNYEEIENFSKELDQITIKEE
jgi:hypothetical protein